MCACVFSTLFTFLSRLSIEDIPVPLSELPDPESDAGNPGETLRQQENKWTDLSLTGLAETFSS